MKETITHSCGHTETIEVFGTNVHGERDREIARQSAMMCKECYAKQVAEQNASSGMAALTGSEKQIAWAEKIRAAAIKATEAMPSGNEKDTAFKASVIASLRAESSSKWWIDHRDDAAKTVAKALISK